MISAASRGAMAELSEQIFTLLEQPAAAGVNRQQIADELYSVAQLLNSEPRLRRSIGDPSTDASRRAQLARGLLTGKVSPLTVDIVAAAIGQRWSSPWDLVDALETAGDDVLLSDAERQRTLDGVEDDLFRFERILQHSAELSSALDDVNADPSRRISLVDELLTGKVNPISLSLIRHAITSARKRRLQAALADLLEASARRRHRSVARVISAAELTPEQTTRLADVLSRMYGREISIRAAVDPAIRGGLVVRVGDEVIDGTVAARMAAARASLAG